MYQNFRTKPSIFLLPSFLLVFSTALTIFGIVKNPEIFKTSWVPDSSLTNLIIYFLQFIAIVSAICVFFKKNNFEIILILAAIFCISTVGIVGTLVPIIFLISSCLVGLALIDLFNVDVQLGKLAIATLVGLSTYYLIIYCLLHVPYNNYQSYSFLIVLPICIFFKHFKIITELLKNERLKIKTFSKHELFIIFLLFFVGTIHLHQSLRPEYDYDALAVHLMIPHSIKANGLWSFNVNQFVFSANQLAADILFSINYMLSGEIGTRFFNFLMFCLCTLLFYKICRIVSGRFITLLVTLTFISCPLMFTQTSSLHIEGVWLGFILGVVLLTLQFLESKDGRELKLLYPIAIIGGTALAIKLPMLFFLPIFFVYLTNYVLRNPQKKNLKIRIACNSILLFSIFGLVSYVECYFLTGNPVFPYFNSVFKSSLNYSETSFNNPIFNLPLNFRTIYDMTFHGSRYLESQNYSLSLAYLLFFLPVFWFGVIRILNTKIGLLVTLTFIAGFGIYSFQTYLRYLIPSLGLFLILLAASIEEMKNIKSKSYELSVALLFVIFPISIIHIPDPTANYNEFSWSQAISRGSEFEHLVHRPQQKIFEYLNAKYGNKITVLHLRQPLTAGLDGMSLVPVWYNPELARRFSLINSYEDFKNIIVAYGVTHIVADSSFQVSPFVTNFLDSQTEIELDNGNLTLYKITYRSLPETNLLLKGVPIAARTIKVKLTKSRKYLLTIDLPSESQVKNDYWIVFDWRNEMNEQIEVKSILENVDQVTRNLEYYVLAPIGATSVDLTLPIAQGELKGDEFQSLVAVGDYNTIPKFSGK